MIGLPIRETGDRQWVLLSKSIGSNLPVAKTTRTNPARFGWPPEESSKVRFIDEL